MNEPTAPLSGSAAPLQLELWLPDQFLPAKVEQAIVRWVNHDQCGVRKSAVRATRASEHVFDLLHEAEHSEAFVVWKR